MTQSVSTLEALITHRYREICAEEAARAREAEQRKTAAVNEAISTFQESILKKTLPGDLLKELPPMAFTYDEEDKGQQRTYRVTGAHFAFADRWFHLEYRPRAYWQGDTLQSGLWNVFVTSEKHRSSAWRSGLRDLESCEVASTLIKLMVQHREEQHQREEKEAEQAAERAKREARYAEEQRKYKEEEARKEAKRQALIAKADEEHQRLQRAFDQAKEAAEATRFCWPEGVAITVYAVEWCRGGHHDEESGSSCFDYEGGWTTTDTLDERGYLHMEPCKASTSPYAWMTPASSVKLSLEAHKPQWERRIYRSMEELPGVLLEDAEVSVPTIVMRRCSDLDGAYRLMEITPERATEREECAERPYSEKIGTQPVAWIRALVSAASKHQGNTTACSDK